MNLLTLISGGIDSPVAGYLMAKKGHKVDFLHFDNRPFTDEKQFEKVKSLVKVLSRSSRRTSKPRLYVCPHGKVQAKIAQRSPRRLGCVLCRRMMLRVASIIAQREGYDGVVTGESLGQVASQTLQNLMVEEPASSVPIIRPIIGLDKLEIIAIAKVIGTFGTSTSPGLCCTIVPEGPATKARMKDVLEAEEKAHVEDLARQELEGMEMVDF